MLRLGNRSARRRAALAAVLLAAVAVLVGCLPAQPSNGRGTPVRRVLVLGDSVTFGLFGTTPRLHERLGPKMAARHLALTIDGFPGETPIDTYPGNPAWSDRLRWWIAAQDPDMVVIQTTLFPNAVDPTRQAAYRAAIGGLYDIAQSRGAHVYVVTHHLAPNPTDRDDALEAEALQTEVAAGRGISSIPLDWWMAHCDRPFVGDGWHLSGRGEECYANALAAAVDQLRKAVG